MNGHTRIENSFLEWVTSKPELTSLDIRIMIFILRKTLGWNKDVDKISLTQFQEATRSSREGVLESLQRLEKMAAIIVYRSGRGRVSSYKLVNCSRITSQPELTRTSQPELTHKRNKETKQKHFVRKLRKNGVPFYEMQ